MTNEELLKLVQVSHELVESIEILKEYPLEDSATFYLTKVLLPTNESLTIPVIHYAGETSVFTPFDWQEGWLSEATPEDIEDVKWMTLMSDGTERYAVMFNGLPKLFP